MKAITKEIRQVLNAHPYAWVRTWDDGTSSVGSTSYDGERKSADREAMAATLRTAGFIATEEGAPGTSGEYLLRVTKPENL